MTLPRFLLGPSDPWDAAFLFLAAFAFFVLVLIVRYLQDELADQAAYRKLLEARVAHMHKTIQAQASEIRQLEERVLGPACSHKGCEIVRAHRHVFTVFPRLTTGIVYDDVKGMM